MAETRKRTVETEFKAKDAGYSGAVAKLADRFDAAAKRVEKFREKVGEFRREQGLTTLAALGLGYGIGSWIEKIKEANAEFGRNQKGIAGILAGSLAFKKGTSEIERYTRSLALSKGITQELDETAARFGMQLDDVATSYKSVMAATGALGLSQKQVMELTTASLATAKRFGVGGEQAATAISRALQTGSVRGFDPFDTKLRSVLGNMKKLNQLQRFDHIEKALRGSMDIADAMSAGIGGSLARAQHVVQDLIRDATGPLFGEISKSLATWSKHIKDTAAGGKSLVSTFSDKLVTAFHVLQDTSKWIKEHWKSIGAVFASIKAADLAKEWGASLKGIGGGMGGGIGGAFGSFGTGLAKLGAGILPVIGALATFKVAIDGLVDVINEKIAKSMDKEMRANISAGAFGVLGKLSGLGALSPAQDRAARRQLEDLNKAGILRRGAIDKEGLKDAIRTMDFDRRKAFLSQMNITPPPARVGDQVEFVAKQLMDRMGGFVSSFAERATTAATDDTKIKFAKQINNFNGGIHITQKFEDQDPDRVFIRFVSDLERQATNRTQAVTAEALGR